MNGSLAVARYNGDGSLDVSFGSGGRATVVFTEPEGRPGSAFASTLVVQADGKLLAAGVCQNRLVMARLNPGGGLDTSFGIGGRVGNCGPVFSFPVPLISLILRATVQSDGKLVVLSVLTVLRDRITFTATTVTLSRYNADGSGDMSFRGGQLDRDDLLPFGVGSLPDGKLLLGWTGGFRLVFQRFLTDGSPDVSFGAGGKYSNEFETFRSPSHLVVEPDGKVLIVGQEDLSGGGTSPFVARFRATG